MSLRRQLMFWLGALGGLILFLWLFSAILLPFIAGMAIAYFLDPLADRLEKIGFNRFFATATILCVFILIVILLILLVVPQILQQLAAFAERLPTILQSLEGFVRSRLAPALDRIIPGGMGGIDGTIASVTGDAMSWVGAVLRQVLSGGQAILSLLSLFVITPVVAFYLLWDWDNIVDTVDRWLPRDHADTVRELARDIDKALAGFVRGQITVSLLLGTFYAVTLTAMGLNFGLLIGIFAGIINIIPYVGSVSGFIVAVGVALFQFWPDFFWIAAIGAIFVGGQMVEGNVLQPKLVGHNVGLHPVWLLFGLIAFSYLFGFAGTLIAVPAAAAVGVLARFFLNRYLNSPFYKGIGAPHGQSSAGETPDPDDASA